MEDDSNFGSFLRRREGQLSNNSAYNSNQTPDNWRAFDQHVPGIYDTPREYENNNILHTGEWRTNDEQFGRESTPGYYQSYPSSERTLIDGPLRDEQVNYDGPLRDGQMNYDGPLRDGQMNYDGPPREYPPFERDHHRQQNDGYYQNDLSNPENDNFNDSQPTCETTGDIPADCKETNKEPEVIEDDDSSENAPSSIQASRGLAATLMAMSNTNSKADCEETTKEPEVIEVEDEDDDEESSENAASSHQASRGLAATLMAMSNSKSNCEQTTKEPQSEEDEEDDEDNAASSFQASRGLAATLMAMSNSNSMDNNTASREIKPKPGILKKGILKNTTSNVEVNKDWNQNDDAIKNEQSNYENEDDKYAAIEKLPERHNRGLMSTLINMVGTEALNRPLDPLPEPRPMKLTDENPDSEKMEDDEEWVNNGMYCTVCETATTCMANFRDHLNGKSHKSTVLKIKALMTDVKEEMPDISQWYTEEDVKEYYLYGITREMLQEASIDSSEYESKLDPNMIGKTTADPEFFCKLCQVQTTSIGNFRDHMNGKSHKHNMAKFQDGGVLPKVKAKKQVSKPSLGPNPESVILKAVKNLRQPVLGLEYITEFHTVGRIVCVCSICASKFDSNAAVSHTTGRKHRLHYLKERQPTHYNHAKRYGGRKGQLGNFLEEILPSIEARDGRGVPQVKIYENEDLFPGSAGSLNEEEKKRQKLVANIGSGFKLDYDEWINTAVNKAAALKKDDWMPEMLDSYKPPNEPPKLISKKDNGVEFLENLLENNAIEDQRWKDRAGPSSYDPRGYSDFRRSRSPSYSRYDRSPPLRDRSPPLRDRSPPRRDRSPLRRDRSPQPFSEGRRGNSPNRSVRSPPRLAERRPGDSPNRTRSPPRFAERRYGHSPDPSRDYVGEGVQGNAPGYYDPYPDRYGYNSMDSSRYISLPSDYIEPDPVKRAMMASEKYRIVPPTYMDPDPLKRVRSDKDRELIDYAHAKASLKKGESSVQRTANAWEEDIQDILALGKKASKKVDSLSMLNSYTSPDRSPSPSRKRKKALPFEKSYLERELESKKRRERQKSRSRSRSRSPKRTRRPRYPRSRSRSPRRSLSPRSSRRRSRSPRRDRSRSPRRDRSPYERKGLPSKSKKYYGKRSPSPKLGRWSPSRRNPSPKKEILSPRPFTRNPSPKKERLSPLGRNPTPLYRSDSSSQRRVSPYIKPERISPSRGSQNQASHSRNVPLPSKSSHQELEEAVLAGDEDAQAEAIAKVLLEMGTEGNLDPHETLQALLRDPKLSGLLAGKPSETKASGNAQPRSKSSRNPVEFGLASTSRTIKKNSNFEYIDSD